MRENNNREKISYICDLFGREDSSLAKVQDSLIGNEKRMQISSYEGKTLYMLAKLINASKIVEVGTLAGYSTVWLARALLENGRVYTIESSVGSQKRILDNLEACGVSGKVDLIIGQADDKLPEIEHEAPFDMIFIDADKSSYCKYLDWAEKNIRKGGLIIGDNSFLFGAVYGKPQRERINEHSLDVMREFNRRLADEDKYSSVIIPTEEGLTVAIKEF